MEGNVIHVSSAANGITITVPQLYAHVIFWLFIAFCVLSMVGTVLDILKMYYQHRLEKQAEVRKFADALQGTNHASAMSVAELPSHSHGGIAGASGNVKYVGPRP